jgi:hypothetical protein
MVEGQPFRDRKKIKIESSIEHVVRSSCRGCGLARIRVFEMFVHEVNNEEYALIAGGLICTSYELY